jgi:hypothetical protein
MAINEHLIKKVLLGLEDPQIRVVFTERYSEPLESFVHHMVVAFEGWKHLDHALCENKSEEGATVSALLYGALNAHIVAMKLLISGLLVPSGNTQRYCLESLAMALLCSKRELEVLARYRAGTYSCNKAVHEVIRRASKLNLDAGALQQLRRNIKFYDEFSHPSLLSLSSLMMLEAPDSGAVLGGAFDEGKAFGYEKEIASRVNLAQVMPNILFGVARNWHESS